ncbi:MAG: hypothetical protein ABEJ30_04815 [Halorientalis sp.]
MFEELASTCECGRELGGDPALVFRTDGGERRAYECDCGDVTVTVARATR